MVDSAYMYSAKASETSFVRNLVVAYALFTVVSESRREPCRKGNMQITVITHNNMFVYMSFKYSNCKPIAYRHPKTNINYYIILN